MTRPPVIDRLAGAALRRDQLRTERHHPRREEPLERHVHPWAEAVDAAYPEIRAEYDALRSAGVRFPQTSDVVGLDQGNVGGWSTYILCSYGTWIDATSRRMPTTCRVLRSVPRLQIAGIAVLQAGAHLPRHRGPAKTVRYHLGLEVPEPRGSSRFMIGSTEHRWAEGVSVLFDDSVEHEAWNDADQDRAVLFIETRWPLPATAALAHRMSQSILQLGARAIPSRMTELDRSLNAGIDGPPSLG